MITLTKIDPLTHHSLLSVIANSLLPLFLLFISQPLVLFGILGWPSTWWDVLILDLNFDTLILEGNYVEIIGTVLALVRPTIPGHAPDWLRELFPFTAWLIFSDSASVHVRRIEGEQETKDSSSPTKADQSGTQPVFYLYVNGICTTRRMAWTTASELRDMFQSDVTVVHNPTDSVVVDLLECIFAKLWIGRNWVISVPMAMVLEQLLAALQDVQREKVVLIAHSQGTIIAGDVLWHLWNKVDEGQLSEAAMRKLEIYNLANCAHFMHQRGGVPYIENIGNQKDNVAMLGAHAPTYVKSLWGIEVDGELVLPRGNKWGHLVSSHYLKHLKEGDYAGSKLHSHMVANRD